MGQTMGRLLTEAKNAHHTLKKAPEWTPRTTVAAFHEAVSTWRAVEYRLGNGIKIRKDTWILCTETGRDRLMLFMVLRSPTYA